MSSFFSAALFAWNTFARINVFIYVHGNAAELYGTVKKQTNFKIPTQHPPCSLSGTQWRTPQQLRIPRSSTLIPIMVTSASLHNLYYLLNSFSVGSCSCLTKAGIICPWFLVTLHPSISPACERHVNQGNAPLSSPWLFWVTMTRAKTESIYFYLHFMSCMTIWLSVSVSPSFFFFFGTRAWYSLSAIKEIKSKVLNRWPYTGPNNTDPHISLIQTDIIEQW